MKLILAIAKNTAILMIMMVILTLDDKQQVKPHHSSLPWLTANSQDNEPIATIKNLQPGKIQTISGIVEALCDDEFILRDDTSSIVVKVDLETKNIRLFQGERLSIIGIYYQEELEAFQIKRANGELIKLNSTENDLL
jgi:uncharacterized protein YdeI (BOF family)